MTRLHTQGTAASRWSPRLINEITDAPDTAIAARLLGSEAIPVFPCVPGGKRPLTAHGFHDASTELDVIDAWWRRTPDANIGIPTGESGGVDVVDVDIHAKGSGFKALEQAVHAGFVEGWAWVVRTPSGGLHAYFLRTSGAEQRSWQVPNKHIDFRGDGGYIVAPPSRVTTDGGVTRRYRTITVTQHAPRPLDAAALRDFLEPPRPVRPPGSGSAAGRPDALAGWMASRPEGGRNRALFWAACRMAEAGHDLSAATALLGEAAYAAGLPKREAVTTIRSAYRTSSQRELTAPPSAARPVEGVRL